MSDFYIRSIVMNLNHRNFTSDEKKIFLDMMLSETPYRGIVDDSGQFFFFDKFDLISTGLNQPNTFKTEQAAMLYNNVLFGIESEAVNTESKIVWGYSINCPENFAEYNLTESDISDAVKEALTYRVKNSVNKQLAPSVKFEYRGIKLLPVVKPGDPGSGRMRLVFEETTGTHNIKVYQSDAAAIYGAGLTGGVTHTVYYDGKRGEWYEENELKPSHLPIEDCFHTEYKSDDDYSLLFEDKTFSRPRFIGGRKVLKSFVAPDKIQTATVFLIKEYYGSDGELTIQLFTKLSDGTEVRASVVPKNGSLDSLNINCKWTFDGGCSVTCDSAIFTSPQQIGGMVHLSSTKMHSGILVNVSRQAEFKSPAGIPGHYRSFSVVCISAHERKGSGFVKKTTLIETIDEPLLIDYKHNRHGVDIIFHYKSERIRPTYYEFYECEIPQVFVNSKTKVDEKQAGGIEVTARTVRPAQGTDIAVINLNATFFGGETGKSYLFNQSIRFRDNVTYDVKFKGGTVYFKAVSGETKQCVIEDTKDTSPKKSPINWIK
jgi:hypothetical protein